MKVVRKCTPTVHQRKKIPTEVVENFMKQGFPEGLMHQIVGQAIELEETWWKQADEVKGEDNIDGLHCSKW